MPLTLVDGAREDALIHVLPELSQPHQGTQMPPEHQAKVPSAIICITDWSYQLPVLSFIFSTSQNAYFIKRDNII